MDLPFNLGNMIKQLVLFVVFFVVGLLLGQIEMLTDFLEGIIGVADLSAIQLATGVSLGAMATLIVEALKRFGAFGTEDGARRAMWITTSILALIYYFSLPGVAPIEELTVWIPIFFQFLYNVLTALLNYRQSVPNKALFLRA